MCSDWAAACSSSCSCNLSASTSMPREARCCEDGQLWSSSVPSPDAELLPQVFSGPSERSWVMRVTWKVMGRPLDEVAMDWKKARVFGLKTGRSTLVVFHHTGTPAGLGTVIFCFQRRLCS